MGCRWPRQTVAVAIAIIMTPQEFSDQFDVFLNSYSNHEHIVPLNEYEKSVYLTKAYRELVTRYYNGLNAQGEAFENSEEARRNLQHLVVSFKDTQPAKIQNTPYYKPDLDFDEVAYIVMESVILTSETDDCYSEGKEVDVVPVTHDELLRIRRNPFKGPTKNRVLRINEDDEVKLLPPNDYTVTAYNAVYIKKPSPIILINLPDGLTIEGDDTATVEIDLRKSEMIHKDILELAVRLALADRQVKETKQSAE